MILFYNIFVNNNRHRSLYTNVPTLQVLYDENTISVRARQSNPYQCHVLQRDKISIHVSSVLTGIYASLRPLSVIYKRLPYNLWK